MNITFNELPYDWRSPGTYVEVRPDYTNTAVSAWPARALLIVQKLAAGTAAVGRVYRITRAADAIGLFGAGSVGAQMVAAFKAANPFSDLYAIALADNAGGVQATQTITMTGAATIAGTLSLYIHGQRVAINVTTTDTPTTIATALAAAINAAVGLAVTATSALGVVTCTARHKGEVGNEIDIRLNYRYDEVTPPGLTVAIAAGVTGATNPDITSAISVVAADWYTDIVVPWTDSTTLAALGTELARRYTATGKLDAHAYLGFRGTFGTLTSKGGTLNSPYQSAIGVKSGPQPGWMWAAALAGVATFNLTNDPARQLRSLVLPGIMAPAPAELFIETEQDLLLRAGISTWATTEDAGVVLERVVTSYRLTTLGTPDTAWLDIMVPKTLSRIRYDWNSYLSLIYPRHKLADDGALAAEYSDNVTTPRRVQAAWGGRCRMYERQGWIEDSERTSEASTFQRSATDRNRMEAVQKLRLIGNLITLAAALEFEA